MDIIKSKQYCKAALRALSTAVAEMPVSEPILSVDVLEVIALDNSHLLVTVGVWSGELEHVNEVWQTLQKYNGKLRTILAQSTHRKRTPQLSFLVVPLGR